VTNSGAIALAASATCARLDTARNEEAWEVGVEVAIVLIT